MTRLVLPTIVTLLSAGAFWLGCGDDDPAAPAPPDGISDAALPDGGEGTVDSAPSEDGSVPLTCDTFCTRVANHCQGEIPAAGMPGVATFQFQSQAGCLHACSKFSAGSPDDTAGDTLACRIYHAGTPAVTDPAVHCPHTGIGGGGVCSGSTATGSGGRCESFCRYTMDLCTGDSSPFADMATCLTDCAGFVFDPGQNELTQSGDTLNCRQFHLMAAYNDPTPSDGGLSNSASLHCGHLGTVSAVCQ